MVECVPNERQLSVVAKRNKNEINEIKTLYRYEGKFTSYVSMSHLKARRVRRRRFSRRLYTLMKFCYAVTRA